jgi:hypothetical protein
MGWTAPALLGIAVLLGLLVACLEWVCETYLDEHETD